MIDKKQFYFVDNNTLELKYVLLLLAKLLKHTLAKEVKKDLLGAAELPVDVFQQCFYMNKCES